MGLLETVPADAVGEVDGLVGAGLGASRQSKVPTRRQIGT
jgi:hypothetical protein